MSTYPYVKEWEYERKDSNELMQISPVVTNRNECIDRRNITSESLYSNIVECDICHKYFNVLEKQKCCDIDYFVMRRNQIKSTLNPPITAPKENSKTTKTTKKKKTRKKGLSPEIKESVLKRDKKRCVKCGSKNELHIHHKIHRSHGGTDEMDNLETLCFICHAEEHRNENVYNIMIKRLFKHEKI